MTKAEKFKAWRDQVEVFHKEKGLRLGQSYMNALYLIDRDTYSSMERGLPYSSIDCFHDDSKCDAFLTKLKKEWDIVDSDFPIVPVELSTGENNEIALDDVSVTYTQNADCMSRDDEIQSIKIFTENNGADRFIVLETTRWAIDNVKSFIELLRDFEKRAELQISDKK